MINDYWQGKRVIVTGSGGFVGKHLVFMLKALQADVFEVSSRTFNLTRQSECYQLFADHKWAARGNGKGADVVFHLAATVGGIGANQRHPAKFLFENATMNLFIANEALRHGVGKLVALGSVCAYPKHCQAPFVEDDIFAGYPEETNAPYGLTKRLLLVHLQAMAEQYGFRSAILFPTNLYGPFDHFRSRDAHVIPMLIDRFIEAAQNEYSSVTIWGTGTATRDFLYVDDVVRAILAAGERVETPTPINVGTGVETRIIDLAEQIATIVGFQGEIHTDPDKPDGQPRRVLDITRACDLLGWFPRVTLAQGLEETIFWRLNNGDD